MTQPTPTQPASKRLVTEERANATYGLKSDVEAKLSKTQADAIYAPAEATVNLAGKPRAFSADWINGKEAGLKGDGVTHDGPIIQTLLNSLPEGGTLYLPTGVYATRQTIFIPPGRRLVGSGSSRWHYTYTGKCVIRAQTPWKAGDNATIKIADETLQTYGAPANGAAISGITIDHTPLPWTGNEEAETVHGLYCEGLVRSISLDDIAVNSARGNAFRFSKGASALSGTTGLLPRGIEANRLRSVNNCRKDHFFMAGTTDSIFTDCLAAAGFSNGFYLYNLAETKIVNSRAVFTGGWGFHIDGEQDLAQLQLIAPSTDRNKLGALYVTSSGKRPIQISAPLWSRDSSDATQPAVYIKGTPSKKTNPIIITDQVMMPGVDDNGSGTLTPRIGMKVENSSIVRATGMLWGVDTALVDAGGHNTVPVLPSVRRTGTVESPVDTIHSGVAESIETIPRKDVASGAIAMASTTLRLTALPTTTDKRVVTNVRIASGGTAAAATPTLVRAGLYREESDGSMTLVGATANDTTALATSNTVYDRALESAVSLDAGVRYFAGALVVTSATAPTVAGMSTAVSALNGAGSRITAQVNGKTDLPATVTTAEMINSSSMVYVHVW